MLKFLHGGIWLALNKGNVISRPVEAIAPPVRLIFPLRQYEGEEAALCVRKGQRVLMGQPVGTDDSALSCSVHSSVSGRVADILEYDHPVTGAGTAVIIENDGRDIPYEHLKAENDAEGISIDSLSVSDMLGQLRKCGLVADAVPALPLWVRLSSMNKAGIHTLVINSVETEPYICRSQKMMDENPEEIAEGFLCMMKCSGAKRAVLAVSDDYENEPKDLLKAAHLMNIEMKLVRVPQKYPCGNESILFSLISGIRLKGGQTPADFGAGFVYVEDCLNALKAIKSSQPQITKIVTVAGDAVENPQNLEVRIGTPVLELLDHCGLSCEPERAVLGSSMRGVAISGLSVPVIKPVSAVLALSGAGNRAVFPRCISCGKCVRVCPQRLLPNYLAVYAVKADFKKCRELEIENCIECGACAYACPGKVPIVELIKNIKKAGIQA